MPKPQEFSDITLCLTMGGRPDLLEQSLRSIQEKWQFAQVAAINDFADPRCDDVFKSIYPNGVLLSDGIKRGHHGAIDKLYAGIQTPYVFHTEDDWIFSDEISFEKIKKFLDANKKVTSYCLRNPADFLQETERNKINAESAQDVNYYNLGHVHPEWYGYSFNPHLIKMEKIRNIGDFVRFKKERHVSEHMKKHGHFVAYATQSLCTHIGEGVSMANPNANKKKSKIRVWLRQQINRIKALVSKA